MGEDNCCCPRWIHTTNYGRTDFTLSGQREPRPKVGWKHEHVKHKGLMVRKCTGWHLLLTAGGATQVQHHHRSRTKNTHVSAAEDTLVTVERKSSDGEHSAARHAEEVSSGSHLGEQASFLSAIYQF